MPKQQGQSVEEAQEMRTCALEGCTNTFPVLPGHRPRRYCSDAHRTEAYRRQHSRTPDPQQVLAQAISVLSGPARLSVEETRARVELAERLAAVEREKLEALQELDNVIGENAELQAKVEDLEDALVRARAELAEAQRRIEALADETTERLNAQEARHQEQITALRELHASEQAAWQEEREELLAKLQDASSENGSLREALAQGEVRRQELQEALREKDKDLASMRGSLGRLANNLSDAKIRAEQAEKKVETQNWEVATLSGERDYLRTELQRARLASEGLQAQVEALQKVVEGLQEVRGEWLRTIKLQDTSGRVAGRSKRRDDG
jgi:chromosome segregation ATPase